MLAAITGLTAIAIAACTTSGSATPAAEVSPSPEATASPEVDATPAATTVPLPTRTPTPVPTVDAAESIGFYSAAYNLLGLGNYADAQRRFDQVVKLEPDFARGWDGLGQANMMLGDYDEGWE